MIDCYRVLVVEGDPDQTVYLRLVLLKTVAHPELTRLPRCSIQGASPPR
jgi:hypothetical protein